MRVGWMSLALAALVGCYAPSFPVGLPCSATGECPEGQECSSSVCVVPGTAVDAAIGGDPDACAAVAEACDGEDNDCDGSFDEGFASGDPCDGPDLDRCPDDAMVCGDGGSEVCGDTSGDDDVELCNGPGLDEDCDGATDEGFAAGEPCDGPDGDACQEGVFACATDGVGVTCGDETGTVVELCDDLDDDCDGNPHNGFDLDTDEANCGGCGEVCTNPRGDTSCVAGGCVPVCNNGAADCDGDPGNGCELVDTNPSCLAGEAPPPVLTVNGDSMDMVPFPGFAERVLLVRIVENVAASDIPITARLALVSGAGTDFDLFVYCKGCAMSAIGSPTDVIEIGRSDVTGQTRTFDVVVEIRYDPTTPSTTCASWALTVTGNIPTTNRCAD